MKKNLVKTDKPGVYKMITEDDYFGEDCYDWSEYGTFEMRDTRLPNGRHCVDVLFRPKKEDSVIMMDKDMPFVSNEHPILLKVMDLKKTKKLIDSLTSFYNYCKRNGELAHERRNHTVAFRLSRDEYNLVLSNIPEGECVSGYLRDIVFARMHNPFADHINYDMVKTSRTVTAAININDHELKEYDAFCKKHNMSRASMARKLIFN